MIIFYNGRDNGAYVRLSANGVAVDLDAITKLEIRVAGQSFNTIDNPEVVWRDGDKYAVTLGAAGLTPGTYAMEILAYSSDKPLGVVWGAPVKVAVRAALGPTPTPAPVFLTQPQITGTSQVGEVLTAVDGTASNTTTLTRQWYMDDAEVVGETGTTYTSILADVGKVPGVRNFATGPGGGPVQSSLATAAAVIAATPVVSLLQFSRRQGAPSSSLPNSNNYTQFNSSWAINNQLGVPVNKIRLGWENAIVHASNGTMIPGPRITAVEIGISPPGNTSGARTLITFGGQTQVSVEPGAEFISDEITLPTDLAAGASIRGVIYVTYETPPPRLPNSNINAQSAANELNEGGTGALVSKATGTSLPASQISVKVILPPAFAIGQPVGTPTQTKRIGFFGDSITSGADDTTTGSTIGFAQRGAQAANVPWTAASTEGYAYASMPSGSNARRFTLFPFRGCSHVISFLGVNDVRSGQTAGQIYAHMMSVKAELDAVGAKLIISTIWPNTNAANNAEAGVGIWDRLNAINQMIRDNNGVGYGFFELNALVRDSVNPNLWAAPGGGIDGTHPGTTHHTTVATALTAFIGALAA